uniref:Uncharacterized protein LOC111115896 n=1 Tax=Crassostrea virginica TaxID=6565 RepID=A0A8B8C6N0_CRAVI|nr:uncharacterized protein LOC111115896 [Crassostrea virginica]XP_022310509.1 uncharacterized protein LOC111115896 [Crassostrea virginica]XP_022310510.1 uncharacterized protein LOC111115896 [Crassostrea virginica]XP_022310511.1 uncharacterized protein LOC111115896 [Crassostrea virginica]XP_022310512.1 uncharacterized protein LOC111115896 [Crassostrea virginica]XP_022310514.1 uncharacterized protein LOC111115896 [Crassostrea virginica]XP_022310515.1 uncharacterized protein LOC111115896 [Crasso
MRKLLYSKHGGKFSNRYQDDIYQLFNALCPGDRKEESKRKKTLTALYSTVNYGSRLLVVKIKDKHPSTSMFAFWDVSRLSIEQTKHIMQTVISNEIGVAKMKILFKESPSPSETATLTLQRIRGTANKERKRKSNGPEPQIPSKVHTAEEGEKDRDFRAKDLIGLQDQCRNLQDLSCKQPEDALNTKVLSSMPFAIPIAQTEEPNQIPAFETTNNEFVTAVVVEYTNNRPGRR